jgi:hypothetical protein
VPVVVDDVVDVVVVDIVVEVVQVVLTSVVVVGCFILLTSVSLLCLQPVEAKSRIEIANTAAPVKERRMNDVVNISITNLSFVARNTRDISLICLFVKV